MASKTLYLENGKLLCLDNSGKIKRLNNSYRIHKIVNDIITNGYTIVFNGNNMILKGEKGELELSDYMSLLEDERLAFLDYDIHKKIALNGDAKVIGKVENSLYLCDDKLLYSDSNGNKKLLDSPERVHELLDGIISNGYRIVLNGSNLFLKSDKTQLELVDYLNLLDHKYLDFLNYDILKCSFKDGCVGKNKVKFIRYTLRNAACFSLAFAMIANLFPINGKGPRDSAKASMGRGAITEVEDGVSALDDMLAVKNSEINHNLDGFDCYFDKPKFLSDNFRDGASGFGNLGNEDFENEDNNRVVEPEFSDEEIEKIYSFMEFNHLNIESFMSLIELMTSEECPFGAMYMSMKDAMKALIEDELSYEIKFLVIMIREGNTYEELDKMCAGVCGEAFGSGSNYDDAYAVASSIINRTHKDSYVNKYGQRLYDQFCAPGQYEVEISGNYKKFLGQMDLEGYHAAIDAFYTRESMHSYIEFRANWVQLSSYEMFVPGGNKFIAKMKDSQYVPYPDEEISMDDVKVLVLENTN